MTEWWLPGGGVGGQYEKKGAKYMVMEDDLTLGGGNTIYRSCIIEMYA